MFTKNMNVPKQSEMMKNNIDTFNQYWKLFIDTLKTDTDSKLGLRKEWICSERPITICPIVTCWTHAMSIR